jgi:uncharacterized membrane protein
MSPTLAIVLLWTGFAGSHMALSSVPVRRALVARLGEGPFRGLYSLVAFAFFVPLVSVYFAHKHAGPWLWGLPHGAALRAVVYVAMGLAFVLVVTGLVRPSPASVIPGDPTPRGIQRITRHPVLMGLGLFGLAHVLPNGSAADVAFFGGFAAFALVGAWHQDRRKLLEVPAFRRFRDATPFVPFTGGETVRGLRELSPAVVATALAVAVVVRWFHASWFGG